MASSERALAALQTPGFYYEADPKTGERASEPFQDIDTEAGLKFYEENIVNNERIADVLKSSFKHCNLIDYRTFSPDPNRVFQFRRGGEKADCILVVLLWPPDSDVIYYSDSLKHNPYVVASDNGLWRVPQAAVTRLCGQGTRIPLKQGGLTIQDGRTFVTFARGKPIAASFAPDEFLQKWKWKKRVVSITEQMEQRLKASENEWSKLYFEFARPGVAAEPTTANT